jgi:hypothetical protein
MGMEYQPLVTIKKYRVMLCMALYFFVNNTTWKEVI